MLIITNDADLFSFNLARQLEGIREIIKNNTQATIRKGFNEALVDSSAQGWINFAREQGFSDMADEMQKDLNSERREYYNEQC